MANKKKKHNRKVNREEVAKQEDLQKYLLQLCVCYATLNRMHVKEVLRQAGEYLIGLSERMNK